MICTYSDSAINHMPRSFAGGVSEVVEAAHCAVERVFRVLQGVAHHEGAVDN